MHPARVTAFSSAEITHAMRAARRDDPNAVVLRRFHRVLGTYREDFPTSTFADLREENLAVDGSALPLFRFAPWRIAWRYGEQLVQRLGS